MNPRLLSSGELEEIFRKGRTSRLSKTAEASFRAHIAALEADSAARLAAFGNYVDMHGVEHDLGCPEDDTCECPLIVALNAAFRDDSPGAALLAEHAKALVRARNDAIRECMGVCEEEGDSAIKSCIADLLTDGTDK